MRLVPLSIVLLAATTAAQGPAERGEKLPVSALDAGTIEPMSEVLRRQRALPPQPQVVAGERDGAAGRWLVPARRAGTAQPHSGERYAINEWGDPEIGIGFPHRVDIDGAWFAAQGGRGSATTAVRALGYRDGEEVARSEWLEAITATPAWLAMDLHDVDRLVIEARPMRDGAGWFALDDLTFRAHGAATPVVVDFEDVTWRTVLTDSGYRGLRWERGAGPQDGVRAVPPPKQPPGFTEPPAPGSTPDAVVGGGTAPNVTWSTAGPKIFDPGSAVIPPDSSGAAGPDHFLALPNSNLSVYRKDTKARVLNVALSAFFALPNGVGIGDVRSVFDPHSQRFVISAMTGTYGWIYLGVSQSSDPTGAWFKTRFLAASGSDSDKWPDFPTLGVDAEGVYLAALMVGGSYPMTIWAIDKAPMLQTTPSLGTVTAWRNLVWEGAIQPCVTFGNADGEYLVSRLNTINLHLRKITGPLTAPTLIDRGPIRVLGQDSPPNAPALGSVTDISTGDFRPGHAMWRNGSLWVAQGFDYFGRAACRWYEIETATKQVLQTGVVADPVLSYFYPAIAVNERGDVAMAFNGSHAGQYVAAYYCGRLAGDPPGAMSEPRLLRSGQGPYDRVDGNGTNRWGDYSYCSVDPADGSFWTIQEYPRGNNDWGTWVARMEFDWFNYGTGWPGTTEVPELTVGLGQPKIGTSLLLRVGDSGAASAGVLLIGFQPTDLLFFDGSVLVVPTFSQTVAPGQFAGFSIPYRPSLVGQSVYLQAIEVDAGASLGLSFSEGMELRIGM